MITPNDDTDGLELLAGGLISGSLFSNVTGEHHIPLLDVVDGPSGWPLRPHQVSDWNAYLGRVGAPARWQPPDVAVSPAVVTEFVEHARMASLDHVRVVVNDVAAWRRITDANIRFPPGTTGQLTVSAYVSAGAQGLWTWRWPLRVGVLGDADTGAIRAALIGHGRYCDLYEVFEATPDDECEVLVVSGGAAIGYCARASIAVLNNIDLTIDAGTEAIPPVRGTAGRIVSPSPLPDWFEEFVVQLSHDLPIDVALHVACPGAVLEADDEFVARSTVRQWARQVADRLRDVGEITAAVDIEGEISAPFDSERQAERRVAAIVRSAEGSSVETTLRGFPQPMAARPSRGAGRRRGRRSATSGPGDDEAAPSPIPTAARPPEAPAPTATVAAGPVPPAPDERRLQAIVRHRQALHRPTVTDRFVAGAEHDVRVCIAAERRAGARIARVPFVHPRPGTTVMLDVSVIVAGQRTVRQIKLEANADTAWTKPVIFRVPDDPARFAVHIEIAHLKRVLQSAVLSLEPLELTVDSATPLSDLSKREPGKAMITLVDTSNGEPAVIDLDHDAGDLDSGQVKQATERLRKELFATFVAPPADLVSAAGQLTRLAVRGSTLYRRLAGAASGYHDDDLWVHVNAFTTADVPLELAYSHPMPNDDRQVPVCPEALAGALSCGPQCPSRQRSDVVCPFGFWATSKILERRSHIPGRTAGLPAVARRVRPLASSVVGVSREADAADVTASTRIKAALARAVPGATVARSWTELEEIATHHPALVVLVTHTVLPQNGDDLDTALELNGDLRKLHRITASVVNPGHIEPGPVVLALGCDTNTITAGFSDLVMALQSARAEIVLSALSPIPGQGVADFLERFLTILAAQLRQPGRQRFGAAMLAARQATISAGDLMALALTASGDADVELVP